MAVTLNDNLRNAIGNLETYLGYDFTVTSGVRTPADQARLLREGYHPAINSFHLQGRSLDIVGQNGVSVNSLYSALKQSPFHFTELLNEGNHVHLTIPQGGLLGDFANSANSVIDGAINGALGGFFGGGSMGNPIGAAVDTATNFFKSPLDFLNEFFSFNTGERLLAIIVGSLLFVLAIWVLISRTQVYKDTVKTVQTVAATAAV